MLVANMTTGHFLMLLNRHPELRRTHSGRRRLRRLRRAALRRVRPLPGHRGRRHALLHRRHHGGRVRQRRLQPDLPGWQFNGLGPLFWPVFGPFFGPAFWPLFEVPF